MSVSAHWQWKWDGLRDPGGKPVYYITTPDLYYLSRTSTQVLLYKIIRVIFLTTTTCSLPSLSNTVLKEMCCQWFLGYHFQWCSYPTNSKPTLKLQHQTFWDRLMLQWSFYWLFWWVCRIICHQVLSSLPASFFTCLLQVYGPIVSGVLLRLYIFVFSYSQWSWLYFLNR